MKKEKMRHERVVHEQTEQMSAKKPPWGTSMEQ